VPKSPSTTTCDLALAVAPVMAHRTVGIRPGEKLHEVMVTEDDARTTLEGGDRYVVEPAFATWRREGLTGEKLHRVNEAFRYGSESNTEFLSVDDIRALLAVAAEGK
jgi:UDP-N-acetylglucosamine 4,6-dehydratase